MELHELSNNLYLISMALFALCIVLFFWKKLYSKSIYTIPFVLSFIGAVLSLSVSYVVGFYAVFDNSEIVVNMGMIVQHSWSMMIAFVFMIAWLVVMLLVEWKGIVISNRMRKYAYGVVIVVVTVCYLYFVWYAKQTVASITDLHTMLLFSMVDKSGWVIVPVILFLFLEGKSTATYIAEKNQAKQTG